MEGKKAENENEAGELGGATEEMAEDGGSRVEGRGGKRNRWRRLCTMMLLQFGGEGFDGGMLIDIEHGDLLQCRSFAQFRNHSCRKERVPAEVEKKIVPHRDAHWREEFPPNGSNLFFPCCARGVRWTCFRLVNWPRQPLPVHFAARQRRQFGDDLQQSGNHVGG